jgi:prolyl oligopeptidase
VLRDADGKTVAVMAHRGVTFFESEVYLLEGAKPVKLDLPLKSSIQGYVAGQMVVLMEQDWPEKDFKTGDLISFDLAKLKAAPDKAVATLVLRPTAKSVGGAGHHHPHQAGRRPARQRQGRGQGA